MHVFMFLFLLANGAALQDCDKRMEGEMNADKAKACYSELWANREPLDYSKMND